MELKLDRKQREAAPFNGITDADLWQQFRGGNQQAFAFLYSRYFPVLYNYGRQFTSDTDLVKDTIQDLFIYLQEKKAGLGEVSSIKFYLYKAYKNRIVRHLNKNLLNPEQLDYDDDRGFEILLSDESGSLSELLDEELRQKLETAFAQLTKRQKEIIIYYFYEGFSYAEITALMGFAKIEYARILMSRTILKLRKELGESRFTLTMLLLAILAGK
ncbi:RNA polymerase sigma factor [Larkinella terrae]|uniref:Sigma-70 family RNA polymerase sigma factor n=1 Tax=Larkinella terrae TaxID=2025311 RepID=A0A7K0EG10_9BACT|nr:sigma-70 family RNA polymerase sigma factor [Larkinella terrae]MRS60386.1 sigma-70 family RNA polymerase sigma factor [Larkinella terrae]